MTPQSDDNCDSYEAACRVAEQDMPGWTAQRNRSEPQTVVSDALPAPSLARMKAKLAAQAREQTHMVPVVPTSGRGGIATKPATGPGQRVVLVQGGKVVGYSG